MARAAKSASNKNNPEEEFLSQADEDRLETCISNCEYLLQSVEHLKLTKSHMIPLSKLKNDCKRLREVNNKKRV